jgi:hypothetical protein
MVLLIFFSALSCPSFSFYEVPADEQDSSPSFDKGLRANAAINTIRGKF